MKRRIAIATAIGVGLVGLTGSSADAHSPRASVRITQACDDERGWTTLAFTARKGRAWVLDDGTARLQVYEVSGRSNGGAWLTFNMFGDDGIPDDEDLLVSGGEGHLRFNERVFAQHGGHTKWYRILFKGGKSQRVGVDTQMRCEEYSKVNTAKPVAIPTSLMTP